MIRLFINFLAASAGGGLTYVRNVIPHLSAEADLTSNIALPPELIPEFSAFPNVNLLQMDVPSSRRFWFEQAALGDVIRKCDADVLLSTGNFAVRKSPVPQILLSRNSIYVSDDYYRDLLSRHEYRAWLDTRLKAVLAKRSISWADVTVAPTEAFARELHRWTGIPVVAISHGFDHEAFTRDGRGLPPYLEQKLRDVEYSFKLLFVSHYNYYRNFETLIRALPLLRECFADRPVRLLLTCELKPRKNPGAYHPEAAAELVRRLGVSEMVVELGAVPYHQLHSLYSRADLYVTAAYTETFAHPLVEAMDSGLPIVASDIPVHREICGDAAVYFQRFSSDVLAESIAQFATSPEKKSQMVAAGLKRARLFSWKSHVQKIVALSRTLLNVKRSRPACLVNSCVLERFP